MISNSNNSDKSNSKELKLNLYLFYFLTNSIISTILKSFLRFLTKFLQYHPYPLRFLQFFVIIINYIDSILVIITGGIINYHCLCLTHPSEL